MLKEEQVGRRSLEPGSLRLGTATLAQHDFPLTSFMMEKTFLLKPLLLICLFLLYTFGPDPNRYIS